MAAKPIRAVLNIVLLGSLVFLFGCDRKWCPTFGNSNCKDSCKESRDRCQMGPEICGKAYDECIQGCDSQRSSVGCTTC